MPLSPLPNRDHRYLTATTFYGSGFGRSLPVALLSPVSTFGNISLNSL
jgi:hypothetical protein